MGIIRLLLLGFLVDADGLATWLALKPLVSLFSNQRLLQKIEILMSGAGIDLIQLRKVWHVSLSPLLPRVAGQQT